MKKFLSEFKEFATKGNAFDLAVGVIIGAAFQAIVNSLVKDIISPVIGLFMRQDFSDLSITVLGTEIRYGSFITAVINFVIMAFVIFVIVKVLNKLSRLKRQPEEEEIVEPLTKQCPFCCEEISISATRCPHCTSEL